MAVTRALLQRGIHVVALSRHPVERMQSLLLAQGNASTGQIPPSSAQAPGQLQCLQHDTSQSALIADRVGTVNALVSCLGSRSGAPDDARRVEFDANSRLLDYALSFPSLHRFLLLSAICVQKPKLVFQHEKLHFEALLKASSVDHTIVRPTAYFKSLSGQVDRLRRGKPFLMFGSGELTSCKPIADEDLAQYVVDSLMRDDTAGQVLPIGGPGPAITPKQQGTLLATALGVPFHSRSINPDWFMRGAGVLERLAPLSTTLRQRAEFLRIAHYYATESMLCWDDRQNRYRADMTPEYGKMTLGQHYQQLARTAAGSGLDASHKLFQ
jgi:divinyl chlorophyllide a 8-vinyl-reductase